MSELTRDNEIRKYKQMVSTYRVCHNTAAHTSTHTHTRIHTQESEKKVKTLRKKIKELTSSYDKSEDDLKGLQCVGQIVGEVLKQVDDAGEKYIVKASSGPRYLVGRRTRLDKNKLKAGVRVTLEVLTLTIMKVLPREVCAGSGVAAAGFIIFLTFDLVPLPP